MYSAGVVAASLSARQLSGTIANGVSNFIMTGALTRRWDVVFVTICWLKKDIIFKTQGTHKMAFSVSGKSLIEMNGLEFAADGLTFSSQGDDSRARYS